MELIRGHRLSHVIGFMGLFYHFRTISELWKKSTVIISIWTLFFIVFAISIPTFVPKLNPSQRQWVEETESPSLVCIISSGGANFTDFFELWLNFSMKLLSSMNCPCLHRGIWLRLYIFSCRWGSCWKVNHRRHAISMDPIRLVFSGKSWSFLFFPKKFFFLCRNFRHSFNL